MGCGEDDDDSDDDDEDEDDDDDEDDAEEMEEGMNFGEEVNFLQNIFLCNM